GHDRPDRAVRKFPQHVGGVLSLQEQQAVPAQQGGHFDRKAVDEVQQQVVRVISGVDQLAASAGLPPRPPAERLGGPFERKDVGGASRVNLAQLALSNHLASRRDRWQEKLGVG